MRLLRFLVSAIANAAVVCVLLLLLAGAGWGAWQILPAPSKAAITRPFDTLQAARRGAERGPRNPLSALIIRIADWFAAQRDLVDTVIAADGSSDGVKPLPAWTSVDTQRLFGATETLWQPRRAQLSGARWSRVVFSWSDIQPSSPREWRAGYYLRDDLIQRERRNGIELVGLLMNTPAWAASRPGDNVRSVPAGLYRPIDDPQNTWAVFVRRMAAEYRGRVDTWIIWNEPDIGASGPNAQYHTWAGDERDYAQLLKVAYLAAHQGNPKARIVFASTTYWVDANAGQPLFLERVLSIINQDSEARASHDYFDVVAMNLYSSPDDLRRVAGIYRDVLSRYQLDAPLWITETNATPYDDPEKGLQRDPNGIRVTLDQQASYVIQAYALGITAGYQRIAIHAMTDRDTRDELWGLVRNDGTMRPAFVAYQTAARYMADAQRATFAGVERPQWQWPAGGYVPNWQVYAVILERPAGSPAPPLPAPTASPTASPGAAPATATPAPATGVQRVSVLWNGDPTPLTVSLPRSGPVAALVDKYGRVQPLAADGDRWQMTLPGATAHSPLDPPGYYYIGGDPLLLVESGVAADAPVTPPSLLAGY